MKYQKFIYFTLLSFLLSQAQSPAFMPGHVITKLNIDPKLGLNHLPIPYLINIYKKLIRLNGMRHNRPVESILWN
jgi:hypothetical protein